MNLDYITKKKVYYHVLLGKITTRTSGWHRQNMLNSANMSEFKAIIMSFNRKNRNPKKFDFTSKMSFF